MTIQQRVESVERILQNEFVVKTLITEALTHASYAHQHGLQYNNERLEFFGDSVLNFIITELLMATWPQVGEGALTSRRAQLVSRLNLGTIAQSLRLHELVYVGTCKPEVGPAISGNTFEALIGALYLDRGIDSVRLFLLKIFRAQIEQPLSQTLNWDTKSFLQERLQAAFKSAPHYQVVSSWGPPHDQKFLVEVSIFGELLGCAEGKSKKLAEQEAARIALAQIDSFVSNYRNAPNHRSCSSTMNSTT